MCAPRSAMCVEKFQIYLADVIVNEKHRPEVAQLLSDIAEKIRSNSSSPLQALETVLGDSSVKFFRSLRVPDSLPRPSTWKPRPSTLDKKIDSLEINPVGGIPLDSLAKSGFPSLHMQDSLAVI